MLKTLESNLLDEGKPREVPFLNEAKLKLCPKSILPDSFGLDLLSTSKPTGIFAIDPLEFARQLTLVEFELFANVPIYECLDQIWKSKRKKEALQYRELRKNEMEGSGINISRLITHTNQIGYWVATMILGRAEEKLRMAAIKWFIQLAQYCKELNNLTGVTTILAGLQMGPVERLKRSWTLLNEKFPIIVKGF